MVALVRAIMTRSISDTVIKRLQVGYEKISFLFYPSRFVRLVLYRTVKVEV